MQQKWFNCAAQCCEICFNVCVCMCVCDAIVKLFCSYCKNVLDIGLFVPWMIRQTARCSCGFQIVWLATCYIFIANILCTCDCRTDLRLDYILHKHNEDMLILMLLASCKNVFFCQNSRSRSSIQFVWLHCYQQLMMSVCIKPKTVLLFLTQNECLKTKRFSIMLCY